MNELPMKWIGAVVAVAVIGGAIAIHARPIMPIRRELPDEILSLGRISSVGVTVSPLRRGLREARLAAHQLSEILEQSLTAAGLELSSKPDVPQLNVNCDLLSSSEFPQAAAVIVVLEIRQSTHLSRLDMELKIPTAAIMRASLTSQDQIRPVTYRLCQKAVDLFIDRWRRASDDPATKKPASPDR
jgi:hypothetical protein